MKAVVVMTHGGADMLEPADAPDPIPDDEGVVVRIDWAGVNFIDTYHRSGLYPRDLPFIPGQEGAGTVVAVGADVDTWGVGDRVAWTDALGSYAELVALPAQRAVPIPDTVPTDVAAAAMLQGLTADYLVRDTFPLLDGDRCLVHAAAGGVGRLLVQMAAHVGAEVFATVGSEEKRAVAEAAGATHVINYRDEDFGEVIEGIAGPRPLDVVYDGVGATTFDQGLDLLKPRGLMVSFGNASGAVPPVDPLRLGRGGSLYLTRPSLGHYIADKGEFGTRSARLFHMISNKSLDIRIGARFSLEAAADAHRALEGRGVSGKILLEVATPREA